MALREPPPGWPRISAAIFYAEPAKAIDWLCQAFGFEVRLKVEGEGGRIDHSELLLGDGVVMVGGDAHVKGDAMGAYRKSPRSLGGANTQGLMVYVDDVDAHCERARAAGSRIVHGPSTTDYGAEYWADRGYEAVDLEGHHWWFQQRLETRG